MNTATTSGLQVPGLQTVPPGHGHLRLQRLQVSRPHRSSRSRLTLKRAHSMSEWPLARRGSSASAAVLAVLAVLAGGCATGPTFVVPEVPASGAAMVYVYRASHLMGAGIQHAAVLDGRPIGTLVNGSYLQANVSADADGFADLRLAGCERLKQPLLLRAGQTSYVQAKLTHKTAHFGGQAYFDYGCVLEQRSQADALPVLQGLPRATAPVAAPAAAPAPPPVRVPTSPLPPTNLDSLRAHAQQQDRTADVAEYLLRLKPYGDWRDAQGVWRMLRLPHDQAAKECVGALIPTPSPVYLAFRVAQDGTVADAHTDQTGFIAECLVRKVVGLKLPPPPWHGFALCHRVEKDGERSVLTPCSGIGWAQRCEQSGTVSRCRLEFQSAAPAVQPPPRPVRGGTP